MTELDVVAKDPRQWPALLASTDGAHAFAFVAAVDRALPGCFFGVGSPMFDRLLGLPGFVDAWRETEHAGLRRALGFRLALLGRIDDREVDATTVAEIADDLVCSPWVRNPAVLDAAVRIYGESFCVALTAAIVRGFPPVPRDLVERALPASPEERISLALKSDDAIGLLENLDAPAWHALERRAGELSAGTDDPWIARASLAVFLTLSRAGRDAPSGLVAPWTLKFTSDFPEEPSPLVIEALDRLPEDSRARLLEASSPFAWSYVACSRDPRVLSAAIRALDLLEHDLETAFAIRAFQAWGGEGRRALASSSSARARSIEEALDAFAGHRPRERASDGAIDQLLDALDRDPAAWPPRRFQFPLLNFGEPIDDSVDPAWASWATVETYASFAAPEVLVGAIRRVPAAPVTREAVAEISNDPRMARLLIALARMVLPAWEAVFLEDQRVREVIDDAERILDGGEPRCVEDRRALHEEAYANEGPSPEENAAHGAARVAVWAHTEAANDGENDEQDTPPDLASWVFATLKEHGATSIERRRVFWEKLALEVIPSLR